MIPTEQQGRKGSQKFGQLGSRRYCEVDGAPRSGFLFPVGDMQGYLNLKAYGEFDNANRPAGWNTWVTFSISPPAPGAPPTTKPIVRKY